MWSGGGRANTLLTNFYFNFSLDCGQEEFLAWDEKNGECFTNPWNTAAKRRKLWCTCNRPGREIGTLLLYGMGEMIDHAMRGDGCDSEDISLIRTTLAEGHSAVDHLQVSSLSSAMSLIILSHAYITFLVLGGGYFDFGGEN